MKRRGVLLLVILMPAAAGVLLSAPRPVQDPLAEGASADFILVEKGARRLSLLSRGQVLKTYRISLGRNPDGAKTRQGDGRTPEGRYTIDGRNPKSRFRLSLHISYPGFEDRQRAAKLGVSPGGAIMIHGQRNGHGRLGDLVHRFVDWTDGCIAVTDAEIEELWRAVPDGTPIEIRR